MTLLVVAGLGSLVLAASASAAPFVVDDLDDAPDAGVDGICDATGADTCTLQAALDEANDTGVNDDITFSVSGTHDLTGTELSVFEPVTITGNGQGAGGTTIDANQGSRVFGISGSTVTLSDLRAEGGEVTNQAGGGIDFTGSTLNLNRVTVTGNTVNSVAGGFGGGGIRTNTGSALALNASTVSDNTVTGIAGSGGGIKANGPVTLNRSTVSGNKATLSSTGQSGGLELQGAGVDTIANSTISGNQSGSGNGGGGILAGGGATLSIRNSTIAGNSTLGGGGGIRSFATLALNNSIVAANSAASGGDNCSAALESASQNNIESPGNTCAFGTSEVNLDNVSAAALKLGPLATNGGPTQTRALGAGSVALDFGDNSVCAASPVNGVDQRGVTRPGGPRCDVGAFEFVPPTTPPSPPPPAGDDDQPETTLDDGPKAKVKTRKKKAKVTFEFSSDESGASFECSLDGGFAACTSPVTEKVKKGTHEFAVRAKDAAGNVDATPAEQSFKVKRKRRK